MPFLFSRLVPILITIFLLCPLVNVFAEVGNAKSEFDKGLNKFSQNNFQSALQHFLRARQLGLNSSKLNYNLGVVYYKLGQFDNAYKELIVAAQDPNLASAAHLNAGMVMLKLKKPVLAKQQFTTALERANTDKQKHLAQYSLNQLNKSQTKTPKRWRLSIQGRYGYNDNVALDPENDKLPSTPDIDPSGENRNSDNNTNNTIISDIYYSAYAIAGVTPARFADIEFAAYSLKYDTNPEYNFSRANMRVSLFNYGQNHGLKIYAAYDHSVYGGKDYQGVTTLAVESHQRFWRNTYFDTKLYANDINVLDKDNYQYLDGQLYHFEARTWQQFGFRRQIGVAVHLESNQRADLYDSHDNLYSSYSPYRKGIEVFTQLSILRKSWLDIRGSYIVSNYPTVNRLVYQEFPEEIPLPDQPGIPVENTTLITDSNLVTRVEARLTLIAGLYIQLNKTILMNFSYQYIDNQSKDDEFYTYKNNRYSAALMLKF